MTRQAIATIAAAAVLAAATVNAHQGVTDPDVRARMDSMSSLNDAFKTVGLMVRGQTAFDADAVADAVSRMRAEAHRTPDLFETRATDPRDEAAPELWDNWDHFLRLSEGMSDALAAPPPQTLDEARLWMAGVGATCAACHEDYRE